MLIATIVTATSDTEIKVRRLESPSGPWVYDLVINGVDYRGTGQYHNAASAWADARRPQEVSGRDDTLIPVTAKK